MHKVRGDVSPGNVLKHDVVERCLRTFAKTPSEEYYELLRLQCLFELTLL